MTLKLIQGGRGKKGRFVCGWCGATFDVRWAKPRKTKEEARNDPPSLEAHFWNNPVCKQNKNTNNPTQTKYRDGSEDA